MVSKATKLFLTSSIITLMMTLVSPAIALLISPIVLAIGALVIIKKMKVYKKRKSSGSPKLKPLNIVIILPKQPPGLRRSFLRGRDKISKSGYHPPHRQLRKIASFYITSPLLILLIITFVLTNDSKLLLLIASLTLVSIAPLAHRRIVEAMRRQNIEDELPFFSLLASSLSHAGISLARAFDIIVGSKILPAISREALLIRREALFVGGDMLSAMVSYAQRHPSKDFSQLILGYASILRSGGDVVKYLEEKTKDLFSTLKDRWSNFVSHVSIIGEATLTLFLLAPLVLTLTTTVFASEIDEAMYQLLLFGITPHLALAILLLVHVVRPQDSLEYKPSIKVMALSASSFTATLCSGLLTGISTHNLVVISTLSIALPLLISYEIERVKNHGAEKELTRFLRYLGENKKLGIPLLVALERTSIEYYNRASSIIKGILSKMKLGLSPYQSVLAMKIKSRIYKVVFFVIDNLIASGGGSPMTFEVMASFVDEYHKHVLKAKRNLHVYSIIGYITPLILAVCLSLTLSFTAISEKELLNSITYGGTVPSLSVTPPTMSIDRVMFYSKLMIVISSIVIGIILGKAVDGSIFSTRHLIVCSIIALASLNWLLS